MYAIVEIAGQQFKVEKARRIFVHRLDARVGEKVTFDRVLLTETNEEVKVGTPIVEGAQVSAEILSHPRGEKKLVFKKKRRKGYQKLNGHRQYLTELLINDITFDGVSVAEDSKDEVSTADDTGNNVSVEEKPDTPTQE